MKKLFAGLLALVCSAAIAQSYPSPTYNNLTVLGTFTSTGNIGLGSLAAQAANTVVANATASSASPTAVSIPSCSGTNQALRWQANSGFVCTGQMGNTASPLSQFASTTSAQLAAVISDETGTGSLVFGTNPTISGATQTGGTINNAVIGGTTAAAGTFTTLTANSTVSIKGAPTVSYSNPVLTINDTSGTNFSTVSFQNNGSTAWQIQNASSSNLFTVARYVSGTYTDSPLTIASANGLVTMADGLTVNGAITPSQTSGIVGTTTNNNAKAGSVGEFQSTMGTAQSLVNGSYADVNTLSLTAGDWDVQGSVAFNGSGLTATAFVVGLNTVANSNPGTADKSADVIGTGFTGFTGATPVFRLSVSSTTTIRLGAQCNFSAGTVTGTGWIRARRAR
ncbi:hypothetical protein [Burkholderia anthina]|uniref:hypothetical protein n=1 Tax=Burkholderia anthina TaxID=179879 RepID=UPI001AA04EB6|nr:hypothetical protein [Burkholderia anthina]QTD88891.1 hypothetical protein J4G50_13850 [Burkholderia anthina]